MHISCTECVDDMHQSETLYTVPLEAIQGKHENLNGELPRGKSCVAGAYLGKGETLILCAGRGMDRNNVAAELGIEAKFIELCY